MFGFGRRQAIGQRAKALGDQMVWLLGMINTMTFEEFVESAVLQGFVEGYRDMQARELGFFEGEKAKADVSYNVSYEDAEQPRLSAQTYRNHYGIILSGSALHLGIGVNLSRVLSPSEFGRDTRALLSAILKFPGFISIDETMARLREER